ncbi:hypothetical protein MMC09_004446 [Bachmanniomyces sp. S44760]|nr:hypothetical protein [Bachmanniomyces sp. S44760]
MSFLKSRLSSVFGHIGNGSQSQENEGPISAPSSSRKKETVMFGTRTIRSKSLDIATALRSPFSPVDECSPGRLPHAETEFSLSLSQRESPDKQQSLHKAASTTFKMFSDTIRSKTSFFYPNANTEAIPGSPDHRTLKRFGERGSVLSTLKSRRSRQSKTDRDFENIVWDASMAVQMPHELEVNISEPDLMARLPPDFVQTLPSIPISRWDSMRKVSPDSNIYPRHDSIVTQLQHVRSASSTDQSPYEQNSALTPTDSATSMALIALDSRKSDCKIDEDHGEDKMASDGFALAELFPSNYIPLAADSAVEKAHRASGSLFVVGNRLPNPTPRQPSPYQAALKSQAVLDLLSNTTTSERSRSERPGMIRTESKKCGLSKLSNFSPDTLKYRQNVTTGDELDGSPFDDFQTPSVGSRHTWNDTRADRQRRYEAVQAMSDETDTDSESASGLELALSPRHSCNVCSQRSPTPPSTKSISPGRKVHFTVKRTFSNSTRNDESSASPPNIRSLVAVENSYLTVDPRFKFEIEAIDREDGISLEGRSDSEDLVPSWNSNQLVDFEKGDNQRAVSGQSMVTSDSCAITTHSPDCYFSLPMESSHHRGSPVRRTSGINTDLHQTLYQDGSFGLHHHSITTLTKTTEQRPAIKRENSSLYAPGEDHVEVAPKLPERNAVKGVSPSSKTYAFPGGFSTTLNSVPIATLSAFEQTAISPTVTVASSDSDNVADSFANLPEGSMEILVDPFPKSASYCQTPDTKVSNFANHSQVKSDVEDIKGENHTWHSSGHDANLADNATECGTWSALHGDLPAESKEVTQDLGVAIDFIAEDGGPAKNAIPSAKTSRSPLQVSDPSWALRTECPSDSETRQRSKTDSGYESSSSDKENANDETHLTTPTQPNRVQSSDENSMSPKNLVSSKKQGWNAPGYVPRQDACEDYPPSTLQARMTTTFRIASDEKGKSSQPRNTTSSSSSLNDPKDLFSGPIPSFSESLRMADFTPNVISSLRDSECQTVTQPHRRLAHPKSHHGPAEGHIEIVELETSSQEKGVWWTRGQTPPSYGSEEVANLSKVMTLLDEMKETHAVDDHQTVVCEEELPEKTKNKEQAPNTNIWENLLLATVLEKQGQISAPFLVRKGLDMKSREEVGTDEASKGEASILVACGVSDGADSINESESEMDPLQRYNDTVEFCQSSRESSGAWDEVSVGEPV